jgi:hypothetical protein
LGRTRVTDEAIGTIAKVTGLEQLDLGYCPITDRSVKLLPAWETLEKLDRHGGHRRRPAAPARAGKTQVSGYRWDERDGRRLGQTEAGRAGRYQRAVNCAHLSDGAMAVPPMNSRSSQCGFAVVLPIQ